MSLLCGTTRRFDSLLSRPTSLLSTSEFAVFYNIVFTQAMPQKVKQERLQVKKKKPQVLQNLNEVSVYTEETKFFFSFTKEKLWHETICAYVCL